MLLLKGPGNRAGENIFSFIQLWFRTQSLQKSSCLRGYVRGGGGPFCIIKELLTRPLIMATAHMNMFIFLPKFKWSKKTLSRTGRKEPPALRPAGQPAAGFRKIFGEAEITKIVKIHQGFSWKVGNRKRLGLRIVKIHQGFSWKSESYILLPQTRFSISNFDGKT